MIPNVNILVIFGALFFVCFLFLFMNFLNILKLREECRDVLDFYSRAEKIHTNIVEQYQHIYELLENNEKIYNSIIDAYHLISKSDDELTKAFKEISEQHRVLLRSWGKIEEGYSESANQYMQTAKDLRDYKALLEKVLAERKT